MDDKLKDSLKRFVDAFELVFDKDWTHTKEMLGIKEEMHEESSHVKSLGLETIYMISPDGTFINPNVEDETEDWGYRGELLSSFRELKKFL